VLQWQCERGVKDLVQLITLPFQIIGSVIGAIWSGVFSIIGAIWSVVGAIGAIVVTLLSLSGFFLILLIGYFFFRSQKKD